MNEKCFDLVVVAPTFNEAGNVGPLLRQIAASVPNPQRTGVLFVDDSPNDLTIKAIEAARDSVPALTVVAYHRPPSARGGGLASAVTLGFESVPSDALVVIMDADLQHPPCTIPKMIEQAALTGADLVVASRYCRGGSADGLGKSNVDGEQPTSRFKEHLHRLVRHTISRLSTLISIILFPRVLRGVTDPMTGFFLVRRSAIDPALLKASGFKILLELLVTHPQLSRTEVALQFGTRIHGESKGTTAQGLYYLKQLLRLRLGMRNERGRALFQLFRKLMLFGLVGLSVFAVINVGLLFVLVEKAYWDSSVAEASVLALSVIANYWLNRKLTWKAQASSQQAIQFMAARVATLLLSFLLFSILMRMGFHYQIANAIGVIAGMAVNFVAADKWVFSAQRGRHRKKEKGTDDLALSWRTAAAGIAGLMAFAVGLRYSTHGLFAALGLAVLAAIALAWAVQFLVSTVYPHRHQDANEGLRLRTPVDPPKEHIATLIPAYDEVMVLGPTLVNAAWTQQDHPDHRFFVITTDNDPATTRTALEATRIVNRWHRHRGHDTFETLMECLMPPSARWRYAHTPLTLGELAEIQALQDDPAALMRIFVFDTGGQKSSKPKQLNHAFRKLGNAFSVYTIIDAESKVQRSLFTHVDQAFQDNPGADVVQGPVQLMDPTLHGNRRQRAKQVCKRWFAWINLLEYFRWFSGQMAFQAANEFVPWGGNTVFVRTGLLMETGGWLETLTEDCSTGVLGAAMFGAKTVTFSNPELATLEETPPSAGELAGQRTRWTQGFFQTLIAGHWKAMPTMRQKFFALWILANPFFQAISAALLPLTIATMIVVKSPPLLVLMMCLPLGAMVVATMLQLVQLHEYGNVYNRHVPWYAYVIVVVMQAPYQWLLGYAAFRASLRHFTGKTDWHKTGRAGDLVADMDPTTELAGG